MNDVKVVVPLRAGSQRVVNKNIRPFADKSLIEFKLDIIEQLNYPIIINTDSEEAIKIGKERGHEVHEREPYYASSKCSNSEYHQYLGKSTEAETILIAQVTNPTIKLSSYKKALDKFFDNDFESVMSVKIIKEFLWYDGKAINYDPHNAPNSQNLPDYFAPTFGIVVVNRDALIRDRNFITGKPGFMELSQLESIDIDTQVDFDFAEFMFKKAGGIDFFINN